MAQTVVVSSLGNGTSEEAVAAISSSFRAKLDDRQPAFIFVFASTRQPLGVVCRLLRERYPRSTVLGASTAGEFTERGDAKGAVAALAVVGDLRIAAGLGTGLKASAESAVSEALAGLPRTMHGYPHATALMLLDPLSGRSEEATLITAGMLGEGVRLAGGAAGDDLHMKSTEVALDGRSLSDAVVIATIFSKSPLGVGVSHGHQPIDAPPLRVTRADGSTVIEIDNRPAWDVWVENTRAIAKSRGIDVDALSGDAIGAYLLRYEAGLTAGDGFKIRAPLVRRDGGAIGFACELPEGAVIRITESVPERQIASAREAARSARAQLSSAPAGAVVFDCICRNLILGSTFADATRGMSEELGNAPIAGFETYGEIALDVGDMSGFHNTTSVVLAFPTT